VDGDEPRDNVDKIWIIFSFNSIKNNFAGKYIKSRKIGQKSKIIRKTGNKHFFKKSQKKGKETLSNFIIERIVTWHTLL
jgi:hypothetical protein